MRMRELRQKKGLTQGELAEAVGVKTPSIVAWESGKNLPRPRRTAALLNALDCTFEELFEEEDFKRRKRC